MAGPDTPELAAAAVGGGADIVEIGIPFSDPLADGPVIRRAGERALAQGMRTAACLECLAQTRALVDVPLVPMTYASILEAYGWERFVADRARPRRDEPDRRRPARRGAPGAAAHPARRADVHRRAAAPRGGADRRLALPRHASPARPAPATARLSQLPGLVERVRARHRRPRSTRASASPRPSTPATTAALVDGIVVGSRAVEVAEAGAGRTRASTSASLRAALDS